MCPPFAPSLPPEVPFLRVNAAIFLINFAGSRVNQKGTAWEETANGETRRLRKEAVEREGTRHVVVHSRAAIARAPFQRPAKPINVRIVIFSCLGRGNLDNQITEGIATRIVQCQSQIAGRSTHQKSTKKNSPIHHLKAGLGKAR